MLQTIRERLTGWVAGAVIVIIGLALVVSFGNMNTDVITANVAATVNGAEIPMVEFRQVYQNQLMRQQEAFQGDLPTALQEQLQRNVLEGMIQNRVVAGYVSDSGYRVSDQQVADAIRSLPAFQVGGEFSPQGYIAALSSRGLTPEAFEAEQRRSLEISQLQAGVVDSAFFTPTEYRRFIELEQEQRKIAYLIFDPANFSAGVELEPEAAQTFYEANSSRFQTDETVVLEYVELRLADIAAGVSVDDVAVRDYYDANSDRFTTEEERRARHILIVVEDEAQADAAAAQAADLYAQLAGGADFAALAQEFSADTGSAADGGDLGWAGRGVFVTAFEDALFELEPGEVSEPVRSEFGYHIIELLELRSGTRMSFEEVRDSLREDLQRQQAEDGFYELAERMDDIALENPGSLEPVAQQLGLELRTVDDFGRSGGGAFGYNQALVDAAFSAAVLEDGENSPLLEIEDGWVTVIRVADHRLPQLRPLDDVREQVAEELRLMQAAEMARSRGQAALDRALAGATLEAVAEEFGASVGGGSFYARGSDQLPAELSAAAFRAGGASVMPVTNGLTTSNGGFAIYRVDQVQPGRPEAVPRDQRDQRKAILARQAGNAALGAMVLDLRADANVVISPDAFPEPDSF
ncbi:MAG: peptidyl-prolyl cis-trans isomerase [Gammaproteobacteria bacterium]|nr:peptidyl-prolyl cis-trans isomerase [Gammaproteobacteria bacterium]